MKKRAEYDIIVVGAGPAGLGAASELANSGLKILLLDKKEDINPVATVFKDIVDEFKIHKAAINVYTKVGIYKKNAHVIKKAGKKNLTYFIDRKKARRIILKRVKFPYLLDNEIINAEYLRDYVKLTDKKGNNYFTHVVIDASGTAAVVARFLGVNTTKKVYYLNYSVVVENCNISDSKMQTYYNDAGFTKGGGFWIFPYNKRKAQIGSTVLLPFEIISREGLYEMLLRAIRKVSVLNKQLKNMKIIKNSEYVHSIPLHLIRETVKNNLIIVGDAAGHATPLIGEGYGRGLELGRIAAQVAKKAIEKKDYSKNSLMKFEKYWEKLYGKYDFYNIIARHLGARYTDEEQTLCVKNMGKLSSKEFFEFLQSRLTLKLLLKCFSLKLSISLFWHLLKSPFEFIYIKIKHLFY